MEGGRHKSYPRFKKLRVQTEYKGLHEEKNIDLESIDWKAFAFAALARESTKLTVESIIKIGIQEHQNLGLPLTPNQQAYLRQQKIKTWLDGE